MALCFGHAAQRGTLCERQPPVQVPLPADQVCNAMKIRSIGALYKKDRGSESSQGKLIWDLDLRPFSAITVMALS